MEPEHRDSSLKPKKIYRKRRRKKVHRKRYAGSSILKSIITACIIDAIFALLLFATFVLIQIPDMGSGICGLDAPRYPCSIDLILEQSFLFSVVVFLLLLLPAFIIGLLIGIITSILR